MRCSPLGTSVRGDSLGKNIGVGCHDFPQGIFPTQVSNPVLLHFRQILYHLSHQGSPRILEWVANPFSRGSSDPGIELGSPALQADSLPSEQQGSPCFSQGTGCFPLAAKDDIMIHTVSRRGRFPESEAGFWQCRCPDQNEMTP